MTLSATNIVLEYICPLLGVVTGNVMFAAPIVDCKTCVSQGRGLQQLNATPWAFMLSNTFGWLVYSVLIQNLFVFFGNAAGFCISVWLNLQAAKMQYESFRSQEMRSSIIAAMGSTSSGPLEKCADTEAVSGSCEPNGYDDDKTCQNQYSQTTDAGQFFDAIQVTNIKAPASHDVLVLVNVFVWMAITALISFATRFSSREKKLIVGIAVNLNLVVFYASPLSSIWTVLQSRNAATIHIPTMLTNTFNGAFWGAYGIAVLDLFIAVPNCLGAALGIVQIVLCVLFPRSNGREADTK